MPNGKMTPEFYNSLGAMHGTIMIFLGIVPVAFAAFGNFVVPLQIGAPDMTFPKINMASYWAFSVGGVIMLVSFFVPGGAAKGGWTSYTPLVGYRRQGPGLRSFFNGQTLWLIGFIFLITSSLLGAVNFIATIIQLRAKGMTWMRLPFFVWAQFVTAFLLLLAFPPLEVGHHDAADGSRGGDELFPAERSGREWRGRAHQRRRQSASLAASVLVPRASGSLRADSARHGNCRRNSREQLAQAALGLQVARLRRARARFSLLHRLGAPHVADRHGHGGERIFPNHDADHFDSVGHHFERVFHLALGRLDSIYRPDAFCDGVPADVRNRRPNGYSARLQQRRSLPARHLLRDRAFPLHRRARHDLRASSPGIYYWFPKATGRKMNEFWGKVHFWPSLICMNVIFLPMFLQGMLGMHRRWYDGGQGWNLADEKVWGLSGFHWNMPISIAAWVHGPGADSVHHQFLLEHQARREGERQSVGSDHPRMDCAFAAAARKFRRRRRWLIAALTNTACRGGRRISPCKTNRSSPSEDASRLRTALGGLVPNA